VAGKGEKERDHWQDLGVRACKDTLKSVLQIGRICRGCLLYSAASYQNMTCMFNESIIPFSHLGTIILNNQATDGYLYKS
jgi:hypothetical protein